jgi:hypothetical protein
LLTVEEETAFIFSVSLRRDGVEFFLNSFGEKLNMAYPADTGSFDCQPRTNASLFKPTESIEQSLFLCAYDLSAAAEKSIRTVSPDAPVSIPPAVESAPSTPRRVSPESQSSVIEAYLKNNLSPLPPELEAHHGRVAALLESLSMGDSAKFVEAMYDITDKDPGCLEALGSVLSECLKGTSAEVKTFESPTTSFLTIDRLWGDAFRYSVSKDGKKTTLDNPAVIKELKLELAAELLPIQPAGIKYSLHDKLDAINAPDFAKVWSPVRVLPTEAALDAIVDGDMKEFRNIIHHTSPQFINLLGQKLNDVLAGTDIEVVAVVDAVSGTAGMIQLGKKGSNDLLSFRTDDHEPYYNGSIKASDGELFMKHLAATVKAQVKPSFPTCKPTQMKRAGGR